MTRKEISHICIMGDNISPIGQSRIFCSPLFLIYNIKNKAEQKIIWVRKL